MSVRAFGSVALVGPPVQVTALARPAPAAVALSSPFADSMVCAACGRTIDTLACLSFRGLPSAGRVYANHGRRPGSATPCAGAGTRVP